ncbi:hypothetical protein [Flavihumibacter sp. ZG627]|uniref:hypothetical protein n=1 Tax=Flavihumibacter sp. ZG627 TaxID=1463156 RepID=UPI00057F948B|nr:hypothetical protein [Flavihumibacter sp. ZG627]KIC92355.1 hypothetical protein HY58_02125 [Flavihumibacter sp. ZG627]
MQKIFIPAAAVMATLLGACNNTEKKDAAAEEKSYFPVNAYISSELKKIDSLQLPVVRYESAYGKTDTLPMTTAECKAMAEAYLDQDITDPALRDKYEESSFADQSIPSINFTYLTKDSSLPLKRVDVVLKPDPERTEKVISVFMDKVYQRGDTLINEKLFWKAERYYQFIRTHQLPGAEPVLSQTKVVWDGTE